VPKTALVVDDSPSMREMVVFTLKGAGFEVVQGGNGQEGLTQLDRTTVQLVITDLNMPIMDGITFIKGMRTRASYRFTPVLVLTTESQEAKKQAAKAAGATGWIIKPFNPEQLLKVIAKVLP
jgi:two-component system, chemotaxis family, chemotaxis protein CheY